MNSNTSETVRFITAMLCITIAFCAMVWAIYDYNVIEERAETQLYELAITNGYDPMLVRCAFSPQSANDVLCVLTVTKYDSTELEQFNELLNNR